MYCEEPSRSGAADDRMPTLLRASARGARLSCVIVDGGGPRLAAGLVDRQRLADALDQMLPVTVLRAPRGFGKTTLAAQWVASLGESQVVPVWMSVDAENSDSETFWASLFDRLHVASGSEDDDRADPVDPRRRVRALLESPGPPIALVVDEMDWLAETDAHGLVDLVRRFPRLHLIGSMRVDHLDRASWLDLDGQVLGPEELAFTEAETVAVLERFGTSLTKDELQRLTAELGGWPLAVRAFALAHQSALSDEHRLDTALTTVRAQLAAAIVALLGTDVVTDVVLASVAVEDFTPTELVTLLDADDLDTEIADLAAQGLLLAHSDGGVRRYRWPGLAREVLLEELERRDPARLREMHRRFARRYIDLDEDARAMRHAVLAEDWDQLRRQVEGRCTRIVLRHWDALRETFEMAPRDAFGDSIIALSMREIHFQDDDHTQEIVARLPGEPDEIERWVRTGEPLSRYDELITVIAMFRFRGDVEGALGVVRRAPAIVEAVRAAHPDDLVAPGAAVSLQCGLAWLHAGDLRRASAEMERSHHYGRHSLIGHILRDSAAKLALINALAGDVERSRMWAERADGCRAPEFWATPLIESSLAGGKALAAVAVLDRPTAVRETAAFAAIHPRDELWAALIHAHSRVALLWGHPVAALRKLDEAEATHIPSPSPFFADILTADRADLMMRAGHGSGCAALLDDQRSPGPATQVSRARLALLSGDPARAAELAAATLDHESARAATDLEALLIAAVAHHRVGDASAAMESLRAAVTTSHGRRDAFALVPRSDLRLLAREVPDAAEILAEPALAGLVEVFPEELTYIALTPRERAVLRRLAQGLTLQAIAHRETLSVNTIKSQVRSLYRKLGVADREHALVEAAREGLISVNQ